MTVADNTQAATVNLVLNNGTAREISLAGSTTFTNSDAQIAAFKASFDALSDFQKDGFVIYLQRPLVETLLMTCYTSTETTVQLLPFKLTGQRHFQW